MAHLALTGSQPEQRVCLILLTTADRYIVNINEFFFNFTHERIIHGLLFQLLRYR